jgi:hypothetical protein
MRGSKDRVCVLAKQRIPRISARNAADIVKHCDQLLVDSKQVLADLPHVEFAHFLALLSEDILRLAIQPDSWGERARVRLISVIVPVLQGKMAERHAVSVEDIAYCSNIVMPCLLLELGRRKRHIEIEFPPDPTDSSHASRYAPDNLTHFTRLPTSGYCALSRNAARNWWGFVISAARKAE